MYLHEIGKLGRMKMSHVIADTTDELLTMVREIGVTLPWYA
ncbi:hypothetical protein BLA18112_07662 [Burkholderia lata]|uniref:Uncharacterized protein n=1 Tax=Burkholderia lata (strain ATCC 17760 / DSM 23089 / LMG 22485 / NCIMB 9086 / R18194 / 383) TaxID=482957 RepID=A0A6P3AZN0_BURL3|nr:DUF4031 domain-containing protein [Burkholderia lata]VWD52947.1 hypothetical protein BLA18112_07662 [Burkholderia lata]